MGRKHRWKLAEVGSQKELRRKWRLQMRAAVTDTEQKLEKVASPVGGSKAQARQRRMQLLRADRMATGDDEKMAAFKKKRRQMHDSFRRRQREKHRRRTSKTSAESSTNNNDQGDTRQSVLADEQRKPETGQNALLIKERDQDKDRMGFPDANDAQTANSRRENDQMTMVSADLFTTEHLSDTESEESYQQVERFEVCEHDRLGAIKVKQLQHEAARTSERSRMCEVQARHPKLDSTVWSGDDVGAHDLSEPGSPERASDAFHDVKTEIICSPSRQEDMIKVECGGVGSQSEAPVAFEIPSILHDEHYR